MAVGLGLAGLFGGVQGLGLGMSDIADQRFKQQQFDIERERLRQLTDLSNRQLEMEQRKQDFAEKQQYMSPEEIQPFLDYLPTAGGTPPMRTSTGEPITTQTPVGQMPGVGGAALPSSYSVVPTVAGVRSIAPGEAPPAPGAGLTQAMLANPLTKVPRALLIPMLADLYKERQVAQREALQRAIELQDRAALAAAFQRPGPPQFADVGLRGDDPEASAPTPSIVRPVSPRDQYLSALALAGAKADTLRAFLDKPPIMFTRRNEQGDLEEFPVDPFTYQPIPGAQPSIKEFGLTSQLAQIEAFRRQQEAGGGGGAGGPIAVAPSGGAGTPTEVLAPTSPGVVLPAAPGAAAVPSGAAPVHIAPGPVTYDVSGGKVNVHMGAPGGYGSLEDATRVASDPPFGMQPDVRQEGGRWFVNFNPIPTNDANQYAGAMFGRTFNLLSQDEKRMVQTQITKDALQKSYQQGLAAAQVQQTQPIGLDANQYTDPHTMQPPKPGTPRQDVYKTSVLAPAKDVKALLNMVDWMDEQRAIAKRRPDLFPPSTGSLIKDRANVALAEIKYNSTELTDPDVNRLKAMSNQVPGLIRVMGDNTISNADKEMASANLGMHPMTLEAALAANDTTMRILNNNAERINLSVDQARKALRRTIGSNEPGSTEGTSIKTPTKRWNPATNQLEPVR